MLRCARSKVDSAASVLGTHAHDRVPAGLSGARTVGTVLRQYRVDVPTSGKSEKGQVVSERVIFPEVTEELLEEIVRRIRSAGQPLRIVLFGSRCRGEARADSDIDLLIIEESSLPRYRRAARYRRALTGAFPAKDVVVWTPAEVAKWSGVPNAFVSVALREGRVLYER